MIRQLFWAILLAGFAGTLAFAEVNKPFPAHWGKPPEIQTQDYVELPAG